MTPEQIEENKQAALRAKHLRREAYFRALLLDRDFQEFIQQGVFEEMDTVCEAAVRSPATTGADLQLARDKWLWAGELKELIKNELETYDRLREKQKREPDGE